MSSEVRWLIEAVAAGVVKIVANERGCGTAEAMREFCSSPTYRFLSDPETGLYLQGPAYVYELYKQESGSE